MAISQILVRSFTGIGLAVFLLVAMTDFAYAISLKKAVMSGTTLSIEGRNAVNNAAITVDGQAAGTADRRGRYKLNFAGYSSDNCIVTVSDGAGSANRSVSGCTPSAPPPPPEPDPNNPPIAFAGPDILAMDADDNGSEIVTLDGSASSDTDGTISSWIWNENNAQIASGVNPTVNLALGDHSIELTVTDNEGAASVDTLIVSVTPPQPAGLPPLSPDHILESNQIFSGSFSPAEMGWSVASAGDVNGDGFGDVVVGAKGWDAPGGLFDEGAVFVFHGGPNGVSGFDPTTAAAFIQGHEAAIEFGFSVAGAGDVNGDGYDDIIVGAPDKDDASLSLVNGENAGAAYVFLGGPSGITATSSLGANTVLRSKQIRANLGNSVAGAGDVNGDGFDDIIVAAEEYGEPFNPPIPDQGSGNQGAAFVFLGSPSGIVGSDPSTAHAQLSGWAAAEPSQSSQGHGLQVASAGDVNADGYADVMLGFPAWHFSFPWPGLDTGNPPSEGAVFIYHGGPSGITGTDISNANTRMEGNQLGAWFGKSIDSAGDVNGDGYSDIIVGATHYPANDPLLPSEEGAVFIFSGGPAGVVATGPTDAQASFQGSESAEWLGEDVAGIGDFDGDGFDDVIMSARIYPGSLFNEGIAYIFRGGVTGVVSNSLASAHTRLLSGNADYRLGFSVASAGDVDLDGRPDIIAGVIGYSGGQDREGAAFVYLGSPDTTAPNVPPVANAGADITLQDSDNDGIETVFVSGGASSDADGTIVSYEWRESATLLSTTASLSTSLSLGDHTLTLTVTDDRGASASDSMVVHVVAVVPNQPPVANAGIDQSVTDDDLDGVVMVILNGTASSDADGSVDSYAWRETGTLLGTSASITVPLSVGVHTLVLQVTDNNGSSHQDQVVITVNAGSAAPEVQATVSVSGSTSISRGDGVSFTVTLTNTGSITIPQPSVSLAISPNRLVKNLQLQGAIPVGGIPAGGGLILVWTGKADKEGVGTVSVNASSAGVSLDTASLQLTVFK